MTKKEWLEVGKQSLYFVLATAGMVLLVGLVGLLDGKPLEAETIIIMLGLWLLMFAMFLGLSPFALDSKQKGMEYLLTLPFSRRRLLFIKLLPRLAAVVLFYGVFFSLYRFIGSDAFGGGFTVFSLAYFALFLISFSLSVVNENFIVQSLWAGVALCGYLALCLYVHALGFSWRFSMPISWIGSGLWRDLAYDLPTLLTAIAVFLLMAAPFIVSYFLAFKKFDLKPSRAFNRRHLLLFLPLLLLALAASLGITYWVQKSSAYDESGFHVLKNQRLLKAGWPGKLTIYAEAGQHRIDTKGAVYWDQVILEKENELFLTGYDSRDRSRIIGSLNLKDFSWRTLHRLPNHYLVVPGFLAFSYDGAGFVYLKRSRAEVERPGGDNLHRVKSDVLELVSLDPDSGKSRTITYKSPLFRKYYEPRFLGCDRLNGLRFWLIAHRWRNVLRLWEDGRVEDLGFSKGLPAYYGNLLFTIGDGSLQVRQLLDVGSKTIKDIAGEFKLVLNFHPLQVSNQVGEMYAQLGKRIVHIDLATLTVDDVGPYRGHIRMVPPGDFYYVEFENWPGRPTDRWRKLYRLQGGKMVFLKQFDFSEPGQGHVWVEKSGVYLRQKRTTRIFAFPDLRELKFKKLN